MFRSMLILYLTFAIGTGPRVCCVIGDVLEAGANAARAVGAPRSCCERHRETPAAPVRSRSLPGSCHNLSREVIEAATAIPPIEIDVAIVSLSPSQDEFIVESIGDNAFAHLEARDMLSALHVLRC